MPMSSPALCERCVAWLVLGRCHGNASRYGGVQGGGAVFTGSGRAAKADPVWLAVRIGVATRGGQVDAYTAYRADCCLRSLAKVGERIRGRLVYGTHGTHDRCLQRASRVGGKLVFPGYSVVGCRGDAAGYNGAEECEEEDAGLFFHGLNPFGCCLFSWSVW